MVIFHFSHVKLISLKKLEKEEREENGTRPAALLGLMHSHTLHSAAKHLKKAETQVCLHHKTCLQGPASKCHPWGPAIHVRSLV